MNEVKALYKELKNRLMPIERHLKFGPSCFKNEYLGSKEQEKDTALLHDFYSFMESIADEIDSEPTTKELNEMKLKFVSLLNPLISYMEAHKSWCEIIELDATHIERQNFIRLIYATHLITKTLSIQTQIRYLHSLLIVIKTGLLESIKEPDLLPLDINKPIEKLILLHQIGIFDFIVNKYGWETQPAKTAALFANLIGIDQTTTEYKTFASNVRRLNSQPEKVLMTKHLTKIKAELIKIGIETK